MNLFGSEFRLLSFFINILKYDSLFVGYFSGGGSGFRKYYNSIIHV
jgi:hypothetical protein